MLPSSVQGGINKVNRRQARQGELRSKRRSPGGEGALGHSVSRKGVQSILFAICSQICGGRVFHVGSAF